MTETKFNIGSETSRLILEGMLKDRLKGKEPFAYVVAAVDKEGNSHIVQKGPGLLIATLAQIVGSDLEEDAPGIMIAAGNALADGEFDEMLAAIIEAQGAHE